jgi:D-alanyl-D-alanine carboxypeptidase
MGQGMTLEEADDYIGQSVAIPGTSEHQTGLGVDIIGSRKMYDWLEENSWKYGFILRYPDDKIDITGIIYEPWHFRYVGVEAATYIMENNLTLEEYLSDHYTP